MDYISNLFVNLGNSWTALLSSFLPPWAVTLVNFLVLAVILVMMPVVATLTLTVMERKVIARIQNRIGPNRVGPWGIFQAIPDAVKLLTKEDIVPANADKPVFNIAPLLIFAGAALLWAVIPFGRGMIGQDLNVGVLYLVAVGSISTIAVIMAGWSSNNKFALIGAFRIVAQLLSYEIPMVLAIAAVVLLVGTMKMGQIVELQTVPFILVLPAAFIAYILAAAAETGRAPFDSGGSRLGNRGRVHDRIQRAEVRLVLHRRVRKPVGGFGHRHHAVPRRLARAVRRADSGARTVLLHR